MVQIDEYIDFLKNKVGIYKMDNVEYPLKPFSPPEIYSEYPFKDDPTDKYNKLYPAIRNLFYMLGMDIKNYGTPYWNPLKDIVKPGDKVLIKPNLVDDDINYIEATITHGSIIRIVIDYVLIALKGRGQVTIADAPTEWANFRRICELNGLTELKNFYKSKGINVKIIDLREFIVVNKPLYTHRHFIRKLSSKDIDIGESSMYHNLDHYFFSNVRYYVWKTTKYHNINQHKYRISTEILNSDVIIMIPKMKTHEKTGVTLSLKNAVGILTDKMCLLHERLGFPPHGDEYPRPSSSIQIKICVFHSRLRRTLLKFGKFGNCLLSILTILIKRIIPEYYLNEGKWYGNDTLWRGIIDINKILLYSNIQGEMLPDIQRRYFSIIDGVISSEKNAPLKGTQKKCGVIVAGFNPVITDIVCTNLMGLDYCNIPLIRNAYQDAKLCKNDKIEILSNYDAWKKFPISYEKSLKFEAADGWKDKL